MGEHRQNPLLRQLSISNERAWMSLGTVAEMTGDYEKTVFCFEKVLSHNTMNHQAYMAIGTCLEKAKDYERAAEYFHHLTQLENTNGTVWAHVGFCCLMKNDLQNAYTSYQHALYHIRDNKDPQLWFGVGLLYEKCGSYDYAEEAYEAVFQIPNGPLRLCHEARIRLAILSKLRGQYDNAIGRFQRIMDENVGPELFAEIWLHMGHIYELMNDTSRAKSAYLKSLEHYQKFAPAYQQLGWLCMKSQSEGQLAIDYLKKAVQVDATDAKGWYLLGRCYMSTNSYEEAYHAYKQAVNCDAGDPNVWCSLGVLFFQLNEYLDALDAYSRAINLDANICEVWYNVGTLYDTCNQTNDARDAYQKAMELGADQQFIHGRLESLTAKENGQTVTTQPPGPSEPPTNSPLTSPPRTDIFGYSNPPQRLVPAAATGSSNMPLGASRQQQQQQQQQQHGGPAPPSLSNIPRGANQGGRGTTNIRPSSGMKSFPNNGGGGNQMGGSRFEGLDRRNSNHQTGGPGQQQQQSQLAGIDPKHFNRGGNGGPPPPGGNGGPQSSNMPPQKRR